MSESKTGIKKCTGNFVDLDEIVSNWAWQKFHQTRNHKSEKDLQMDDVMIRVDWKDVTFSHSEPCYGNDELSQLPHSSTLFKTTFENLTDDEQTYTFQTNRSTRSTCEVELGRTYTHSGEVSVKLSVPGSVLEANAGFKSQLELSRTTRQVIENELSWGVDTQVRVKPHHLACAEAHILEKKQASNFKITTVLTGKVRAILTNLRDNNSLLRATSGPIQVVIATLSKDEMLSNGIVVQNKEVHLFTEGSVAFRFGAEQKVTVNQQPLKRS